MSQRSRSIPPGTCLITRLKDELLPIRDDWPHIHVVLPTQRLHVFLARELAVSCSGGCLLPRLWTWDQWVQELAVPYESTSLVMVSSQCELIMESVLENLELSASRPRHTNRRHAHELLYLASELDRSGRHDVAKQTLCDWIDRDWRRDDVVRRDILARIDDIFEALASFQSTLQARGWVSESAARSRSVLSMLSDPQFKPVPSARRVIIAGLTSLPELESSLLLSLAADERVEVWLDEPAAGTEHAPLGSLRKNFGLTNQSPSSFQSWAPGVRRLIATHDVTEEITASLLWAQDLLAKGLAAHEIAIVVPDESSYAPAYQALAPLLGLSVNMPLSEPWQATLPARWLHLVTEVAKGFKTQVIGQYLLHPMTIALFYDKSQNQQLDQAKLQHSLKNFPELMPLDRDNLAQLLSEFVTKQFSREDGTYMIQALNYCLDCPSTDGEADIVAFVTRFLTDLASLRSLFKSTGSRDESAWNHCETAAYRVQALAGLSSKKGPAAWREFLTQCYRCAASESVRQTGEPMDGVQVIGLTEARYVPFAAVRIVGCVEGSFPHALPSDSLVDNSMRSAMGLVGFRELEALEDTTFHLLTSRLPWVELSYAQTSNDRPLIRSRWIEQLAPFMTIDEFSAPEKPTAEVSTQLQESSQDLEGAADDVEALTQKASASRLRDLFSCPYRYLMTARKIQRVELPEDRTQLKTGDILHKILERFFTTAVDDSIDASLGFSRCPTEALHFVDWAHGRLHAIARVTTPKNLARLPQFQHMTGRGWRQVAERWGALYAAGFAPKNVTTEMQIGRKDPLILNLGHRQISVEGRIDAVFQRADATLLIDYKTGQAPSIKSIAEGQEPQLPLYAWSVSQLEPLRATAVSYFNLSEGQQSIVAVTTDLKPTLTAQGLISASARPADLDDAFGTIKTRWTQRLNEIETTRRFMADDSNCEFCPYDNVCRKNDPRYTDRIRTQSLRSLSGINKESRRTL
jgi:hypothetical protein